jgi:hypothetical protein
MGDFWDEYTSLSGLDFIKEKEKDAMIEEQVPFTALKVIEQPPRGQYGPKYVVIAEVRGDKRAITFGKDSGVDSRDNLFESLIGYFERDDAVPPTLVMRKAGQAILVDRYEELEPKKGKK